MVTLQPQRESYTLNLADLENAKMTILPRPYPGFLPYYFSNNASAFSMEEAETIQISIGPGMTDTEKGDSYEIAIESIWLE